MNYFSKNLKTLRAECGLNQEAFGRLFDLTKQNINSYENTSSLPKLIKYLEITDHFNLDPDRFVKFDMTKHDVHREAKVTDSENDSEKLDEWFQPIVTDTEKFKYLNDLEASELRKLYVKLSNINSSILKENLELKSQLIAALQNRK
ncbi:MAG: helix-turn-helix transcriptional regulator [Cyclobacteriaceae bacterium]